MTSWKVDSVSAQTQNNESNVIEFQESQRRRRPEVKQFVHGLTSAKVALNVLMAKVMLTSQKSGKNSAKVQDMTFEKYERPQQLQSFKRIFVLLTAKPMFLACLSFK